MLLRMHWGEAGLLQNFQIIDADDQVRLIKRILKNLDLDEKKWPARQAAWFINEQKMRVDDVKMLRLVMIFFKLRTNEFTKSMKTPVLEVVW